MTTKINPAAPASVGELLSHLLRSRLLDEDQARRLMAGWPDDLSVGDAAERLVQAGLVTPYQAEQTLAGHARRLRLGPYRLLEQLGVGGSGKVFKAEHVLMKRLVTLKVFARSAWSETGRHEVVTAAGLSHPNLATAHHATRLRGRVVFVLEFVDGVDLEQMLAQTGPLPIDLACEVIRQTAQALAYMHGRGILHRDVKPANLLLAHTAESARPVVKLIDLGLARPAGHKSEIGGTVDFMAPESGTGELVDARSDLYSLGCTFYTMLTAEVPHPGGTWTSKLVRHRTEDPTPITTLRPDIPPHLAAIVQRLMAREPGERFASAAALLSALDAPAAPPMSKTTHLPRPRSVRPRARRWRSLLLCVLVAVLLGTGIGGVSRWAAVEEPAWQESQVPRNIIRIAGREEEFSDLQRAIDDAPDGGVITLDGPGPFRAKPLVIRGKSLTIRAVEGRSRLERKSWTDEVTAFDALILSDRNLRLEGLELAGSGQEIAPLVSVEGGGLELVDCVLKGRGPGPLVALRRGRMLRIERGKLDAATQGVAVEVGQDSPTITMLSSKVTVREVTGAAILLWSVDPLPTPVSLQVQRSEIEAGRIVALRAMGGRVNANARACRFTFYQALASLDACLDRRDWKAHLRWSEQDNTHTPNGPFLRQEGKPLAWSESAWRRLACAVSDGR